MVISCSHCHEIHSAKPLVQFLPLPPPFLHFEIRTAEPILPSLTLVFCHPTQPTSYKLCAIIYFGGQHFTCCLIPNTLDIWLYDGQVNGGNPVFIRSIDSEFDLTTLLSFFGRKALIYIYKLTSL
ncbi:hypothetical protein BJ138DRAFT_1010662 [Hygrophoropsis aurantiaca]|uniref:Uncharacterized protein n=1 Tax=Hygrophoropsis aurantiaca TaxID=72124 RepID=A0ACB8A7P1_9AGAM|nr:hypothetical protein BJ138DRAFT_1010662 [Hygrophoropsis aurantiaca]